MVIRLYSLLVLLYDVVYLCLYICYCTMQALYRIVISPNMSRKSVHNEVVVVIGASRGIGQAMAIQLGLLGANVICVDVNSIGNEATVKKIKIAGGQAYGYTCDVTLKEQVERMVQSVEREVAPITMLFHCCGLPSPRSYTREPPPVQDTINISIMSHFWILDAVLPRMKQRNYGHVCILTSVAGCSGIKNQAPLTVSQFAVHGLFESVMEELRVGRFSKSIKMTLAYIYPFVITEELEKDIRFRIPSYFGTMKAREVAHKIIEGVRRNDVEVSIPKYWLWLGHLTRLMPRNAADALREFLDTGMDFG